MLRKPDEVLNGLVAGGMELIRARDPNLAAQLDVPPPVIRTTMERRVSEMLTAIGRPLLFRGARKIYRGLKRIEFLQPTLMRLRHSALRRLG